MAARKLRPRPWEPATSVGQRSSTNPSVSVATLCLAACHAYKMTRRPICPGRESGKSRPTDDEASVYVDPFPAVALPGRALCRGVPRWATYHRYDGLVMMDYDKCIGCRYCMLACPMGAPLQVGGVYRPESRRARRRTSWRSSAGRAAWWRKCSFCVQRIDRGLATGLKPGIDPTPPGLRRRLHLWSAPVRRPERP